jgi:hypothetical protein
MFESIADLHKASNYIERGMNIKSWAKKAGLAEGKLLADVMARGRPEVLGSLDFSVDDYDNYMYARDFLLRYSKTIATAAQRFTEDEKRSWQAGFKKGFWLMKMKVASAQKYMQKLKEDPTVPKRLQVKLDAARIPDVRAKPPRDSRGGAVMSEPSKLRDAS